jgi:hypothetical protein
MKYNGYGVALRHAVSKAGSETGFDKRKTAAS